MLKAGTRFIERLSHRAAQWENLRRVGSTAPPVEETATSASWYCVLDVTEEKCRIGWYLEVDRMLRDHDGIPGPLEDLPGVEARLYSYQTLTKVAVL